MGINKKLISKKKPFYPISEELKLFLKDHDRWMEDVICLLYTSPSPRDVEESRMPSSA